MIFWPVSPFSWISSFNGSAVNKSSFHNMPGNRSGISEPLELIEGN